MFKRTGESNPIQVVKDYDKANESAVSCPSCGKAIPIKASNDGLKRIGSKIVIGSVVMVCPHCNRQIAI